MTSPYTRFFIVFAFVLGCAMFVNASAGVKWGTQAYGLLMFLVMPIAALIAAYIANYKDEP